MFIIMEDYTKETYTKEARCFQLYLSRETEVTDITCTPCILLDLYIPSFQVTFNLNFYYLVIYNHFSKEG